MDRAIFKLSEAVRKFKLYSMAILMLPSSLIGILPIQKAHASPTITNNLVYTIGNIGGGNSELRSIDAQSETGLTTYARYGGFPRFGHPEVNHAKTKLYADVNGGGSPTFYYDVGVLAETQDKFYTNCLLPAISPNDMKLACISQNDLRIVDIATGSSQIVKVNMPNSTSVRSVDWLTDSRLIVSAETLTCVSILAHVNVDGTGFATQGQCSSSSINNIKLSPSKTRIAYESTANIYTRNIDGSNPQLLLSNGVVGGVNHQYASPDWSLDGNTLVATDITDQGTVRSTNLPIFNADTGAIYKRVQQQSNREFVFATWAGTYTLPDGTPPTVISHLNPAVPSGANGWYTSDVAISWAATDPTPSSGTPTQPPTIVASQEGTHAYTSAQSCDPAGNCATGSVTLKIDKSNPTISYVVSPVANADGWQNGDVTVSFTCADAVSSVETCTAPVTVSVDGQDQTVSGTALDKAGNSVTTTALVSLDETKPGISYTATPAANVNGWNNTNVAIAFDCTDLLSGITSCTGSTSLTNEGAAQTVTGTATDKAGNTKSLTTNSINIDKTNPAITYTVSPAANANGWYNGDITVTFSCSDALSGVDECTSPITLSSDGQNQTVSGTVTDKAGNTATVTATISRDTVDPTITYAATPAANANGWRNSDVTIAFACADELSGVNTCSPTATLAEDGANQTATGTATDNAGNTASTTTGTINIDKTAPSITYTVSPAPNSNGQNNTAVTVTFQCADIISGIEGCTAPVTISTDGQNQSVVGTATDRAGNTSTVTATINLDSVAPVVTHATNVLPNADGWFNSNVIIDWSSTDPAPSSGFPTQPLQTVAMQEGIDTYTSSSSCDPAANCATDSVTLKIDKTAPAINYSVSSAANANGWNSGAVTITFSCADIISGVASCSVPVTLTNDGLGQIVTGTAIDQAGNTSTITVVVNIDSGKPTIVYAASPAANSYGWNNTDVNLTFTCMDSLSGIASCTGSTVLTAQGANQTRTGTALDRAGNTASITTVGINIDKTAPTASNASIPNSILGNPSVTITADASDALSGVVGGEYYIDTDPGLGQGKPMTYINGKLTATGPLNLGFELLQTHRVYIRSIDKAGNYSPVTSKQFSHTLF